jgi:hypothetical protein
VAPFCTGVFAGDPEQLSLRAAFPKLAALEAEGGLVRGSALRMLRRALGQEERRGEGRPRLSAPQGGMSALVDALAREIGPRLRLGRPAVAVEVEAGGRARALRFADGGREPYDLVVLATPAPAAARLVSDASRELARLLDSIPYAPVAAVHLGYRRAELHTADVDGGDRLDGFGFLVARGEEMRILGAVFESVIWPSRAPDGHVLIRCILGGTRDPAVLELDDRALIEHAHRDLERALGLGALPVHRHVVRAIAQYTLGHIDRVARAEELADPLGVVLAGASYHGVAVNACAADAGRVAHRVAARLGLPVTMLMMIMISLGMACSSGAVPGASRDAGEVARPIAEPAPPAAGPTGPSPEAEQRESSEPPRAPGSVDVAVEWLSPPAELVSPAGRNRCGSPRRSPLQIASLGGVEGAVVRLEGVPPAALAHGKARKDRKARHEAAEIAVRGCQIEPRTVRAAGPGAALALTSFDEQRHEIAVDAVPQGKGEAARLATVPLVLVGQRVELDMKEPGLVRVASAADPESAAWIVVPEHGYVAVSDERGKVRFEDVPAGRYEVSVWVAPDGSRRQPITARAAVEVPSGDGASTTVSLRAPARR